MDLNKEKKNEKLEETLKDKQSFPEPRAFQVLKKKKRKKEERRTKKQTNKKEEWRDIVKRQERRN